jgi:hypothetical protein
MMNKEMWVIMSYFSIEPSQIYGIFASQKEAIEYAESHGFAAAEGMAYETKMILDIEESI